ncbi:FAD-linked sulfhydryl oxidase ERV1 isoform X1 [Prunus yedoensis var. nudiflora]|uniref:Sulfhydryl oxidase n=1 Tax=Prunus yedoensis var. nudiflora TaxID=2094558 RepID=A0A314ZIE1_PRUYE|nr:FAD-linked sulfhydryl oxidase ERV1 isoform X1 [Prunus yedoensis var. nudiflora]
MSEHPLQALFQTVAKVSNSIQAQLSNLIGQSHHSSPTTQARLFSVSSSSKVRSSENVSTIPSPPISSTRKSCRLCWISLFVFCLKEMGNSGRLRYCVCSNIGSAYWLRRGNSASPLTKEELGRATWTFLHTLAAQNWIMQSEQLILRAFIMQMSILSRMYPCKECADHFQEILRSNPVQAGSHAEFSQWLCHVHNTVNRSLSKPVFPCERVDARWGKLECEQRACDLLGLTSGFEDKTY